MKAMLIVLVFFPCLVLASNKEKDNWISVSVTKALDWEHMHSDDRSSHEYADYVQSDPCGRAIFNEVELQTRPANNPKLYELKRRAAAQGRRLELSIVHDQQCRYKRCLFYAYLYVGTPDEYGSIISAKDEDDKQLVFYSFPEGPNLCAIADKLAQEKPLTITSEQLASLEKTLHLSDVNLEVNSLGQPESPCGTSN